MDNLREKLTELLCEASSLSVDAELFEDSSYAKQLEIEADHLIANGVTVQRWIPVTERLPDGECVAIGYQNEMLIGFIGESQYSDTGYAAESDGGHLDDVTHWMPLPEPPREAE